ncbi:beta-adaptin AP complex subunit-related protein [Cryptosporidium canis]|uniref:AP complex subunit beta n=1 Tax=Cryptosporidium canis TaxID=195482 RepID=A0ABQ8P8U7_9CRYT|nr:beta-adaptin AP complex subunit-related protein [Cryptosporidium canis]
MRKGGISITYGDAEIAAQENAEPRNGGELFVDHRRGEVNDLYERLQDITLIKDREKRIELFEKAIALMTLGVDVSSLYSLMILASATQDQVEKKIIYLYLTHYAERNSDLALLMVNTLRKDSEDEDPVIRSLALRSFSSLKIPIAMEYIEPILKNGLSDPIGYVRKTAVMGCLKFFQYSKKDFSNTNLLEILTSMLDTELDPNTIINLVYVLNEINRDRGGATFSRHFILKILSNIKSFSEWSQYHVLQLISKNLTSLIRQPRSGPPSDPGADHGAPPPDIFQVLNALEEVIRHSSANVLLVSVQIFISLTLPYPRLFSQVVQRIKGPLFTHASTSIPEISIVVYSHMRLLFSFFSRYSKDGSLLEDPGRSFYSPSSILCHYFDEFKQLLLRNGDPFYIQDIKLDLIPFLSSEESTERILEELYHYSFELSNPCLVHKSIYLMALLTIKHIQIRLDSDSEELDPRETLMDDHIVKIYINYTKDLMRSDKERVLSPALMGMELVSECFPWVIEELVGRYFQESLVEKLTFMTGGICSFVWIMARFPDYVYCDKARVLDYIVSNLLEVYERNVGAIEDFVDRPSRIFSILITSSCKLLFHSPEEMRPVLGRLLAFSIEKMDYPDVKDLALFYYRLLQFDYKIAKRVIQDDPKGDVPGRDVPTSISILGDYFHRWSRKDLFQEFNTCSIVSEHYKQMGVKFDFFGHCEKNETEDPHEDSVGIENRGVSTGNSLRRLPKSKSLRFKQSVAMEPSEFERLWEELEQSSCVEERLGHQSFEDFGFMAPLEDELGKQGVVCIASGQTDETSFKLFAFCGLEDPQSPADPICLCEIDLRYSAPERMFSISTQIKVDVPDTKDCNTSLYCNHLWSAIRDTFRSHLKPQ